uniref:NADH-ubiquinone oxidoreductase chain 6 n=1 Tax=Calvia championorum TaxID=1856879 RepID=A0A191UJ48_9CUCU|nr:NADH dehydrogenase subunit 6 [Calvia championorum]
MYLLMLTSTLMVFLKHPISMGFIILIHTIITCLIMGMMSLNFWFSYILILVMIGGLLVLFIYMTSIASNEKFKFNKMMLLFTILIFLMILMTKFMENNYLNSMNNELISNLDLNNNFNLNLSKFLNFPNSNIFILIIFYLLMSMIAIVKITKFNFGPLRQFK